MYIYIYISNSLCEQYILLLSIFYRIHHLKFLYFSLSFNKSSTIVELNQLFLHADLKKKFLFFLLVTKEAQTGFMSINYFKLVS